MDCFGKSQKAAEETKIATAREKISIRVAEIATDIISKENRNLKVEDLLEIENNEITVQKNTDGTIYTEVDEENKEYVIAECDGYKFKVYASGAVELYIDKELVQIKYEKTSVSADRTKITILITVIGNKGLEKVIKPDNLEVYPTEDRNKISLDFTADSGVDYTFKAIGKGGTEETKVINVIAGDIYTIEDLEDVKVELGLSYRLMKDLDFKDINSYKTEEKYDYYNQDTDGDGKPDNSWEPIGNSTTNFTGTFDGQYYTINNLYINSTIDYTGLFGYSSGTIKKLKLENIDVTSTGSYVGGLVGYALGYIDRCAVRGKVSGVGRVGGLIGEHNAYITLNELYADCEVTSTGQYSGVLIGWARCTTIKNAYTSGEINGGSTVGGLTGACGYREADYCYSTAKVTGSNGIYPLLNGGNNYSYWAPECSGILTNSYGNKRRMFNLFQQDTFEGWDFDSIWAIDEGTTTPYLQWIGKNDSIKRENIEINKDYKPNSNIDMEGKGTTNSPYIITTIEQLEDVRLFLEGNYILGNDIDLSTKYGEEKLSWTPLGNGTTYFTGTFDGNYHKINNLYINTNEGNQGLFGCQKGAIKNLKLENINVESTSDSIGGLIGYSLGPVEQVKVTGYVKGNQYVGGLIGFANGYNVIQNTYSECNVEGNNSVGGTIGWGRCEHFYNSYSIGHVEGNKYVGGICGRHENGSISSVYWDKQTSEVTTGSGTGKTTLEMQTQSTYENWDFDTIWTMNGYPKFQWE